MLTMYTNSQNASTYLRAIWHAVAVKSFFSFWIAAVKFYIRRGREPWLLVCMKTS